MASQDAQNVGHPVAAHHDAERQQAERQIKTLRRSHDHVSATGRVGGGCSPWHTTLESSLSVCVLPDRAAAKGDPAHHAGPDSSYGLQPLADCLTGRTRMNHSREPSKALREPAHLDREQAVEADVLGREVLAPHVGEHEDQAGAAEPDPEERDQQADHLRRQWHTSDCRCNHISGMVSCQSGRLLILSPASRVWEWSQPEYAG